MINDLTLHIHARKPFSPLKKLDGNLHHLPKSVQFMVKVTMLRSMWPPWRLETDESAGIHLHSCDFIIGQLHKTVASLVEVADL